MYLHRCLSLGEHESHGFSLWPPVLSRICFGIKLPNHIRSIYKYSNLGFLNWWEPGQGKHANFLTMGFLKLNHLFHKDDSRSIAFKTNSIKIKSR